MAPSRHRANCHADETHAPKRTLAVASRRHSCNCHAGGPPPAPGGAPLVPNRAASHCQPAHSPSAGPARRQGVPCSCATYLRLLWRAPALLHMLCRLLFRSSWIKTCPVSARGHAWCKALAGCCMRLACTWAQAQGLLSSLMSPSRLQHAPGRQHQVIHVPSHRQDSTQPGGVALEVWTQQGMQAQGPWSEPHSCRESGCGAG